jgi:hypothetical protein
LFPGWPNGFTYGCTIPYYVTFSLQGWGFFVHNCTCADNLVTCLDVPMSTMSGQIWAEGTGPNNAVVWLYGQMVQYVSGVYIYYRTYTC